MQNYKEQQGDIKKPSSVINATKEENNKMGKTRDLFKKIKDTKGTFSAKMGIIKNRNSMDLREAEEQKTLRKDGKNTQRTVQKRSSQPR